MRHTMCRCLMNRPRVRARVENKNDFMPCESRVPASLLHWVFGQLSEEATVHFHSETCVLLMCQALKTLPLYGALQPLIYGVVKKEETLTSSAGKGTEK